MEKQQLIIGIVVGCILKVMKAYKKEIKRKNSLLASDLVIIRNLSP